MSRETANYKKYLHFHSWKQDQAEEGIKFRIEDYDDRAQVWHSIFFGALPPKEILPEVDGEVRVLDLGCNTGYNTRTLRDTYGYAAGLDANTRLIGMSRYNIDTCVSGDVSSLEFDDESFSLVVAKDVLEHTFVPDKALSEAYRVLADGGHIVAMIPLDGDPLGFDDVLAMPPHLFGNSSHPWKATDLGVLRRFLALGFTDIQCQAFSHSQLFGEERPMGDRVLVISAVKRNDVVKVPSQYLLHDNHWAAFLTFTCTANCWYCIQHVCKDDFVEARTEYEKNRMSGEEWVNYYNSLQKWEGQRLSIIGGEPTLHKDFFEIVNGLKGYYLTITTNLSTDAVLKFGDNIKDKKNLRINTSYHPELMTVDDFADRVHLLRSQGFLVDQVAMVDTPMVDFRQHHTEFLKRGIAINPQSFLGILNGELLPNPESSVVKDYGETGIDDRVVFEEGFSCKEKNQVLCRSGRFLVAPDGGIYRCHYQLYSRTSTQGDAKALTFPVDQDFRLCNDYGFCNPCDFPHVQFRPIMADIEQLFMQVFDGNKEVVHNAAMVLQEAQQRYEGFNDVFNQVFNVLYSSLDPWWELYNNEELIRVVNEYICEDGMVFNENAESIAAFEYALFRQLKYGVNLYRVFTSESMVKYLAAVGAIHAEIFCDLDIIKEFYGDDVMLFSSLMSKIMSTFGTSTAYEDMYVAKKEVTENEQ